MPQEGNPKLNIFNVVSSASQGGGAWQGMGKKGLFKKREINRISATSSESNDSCEVSFSSGFQYGVDLMINQYGRHSLV
jgi:hypothetical protein